MADVPADVVTLTSTVPEPAGAVAVIWLEDTVLKLALAPPNDTPETFTKFAPLIVTAVPLLPDVGEMPETDGS